MNPFDKPIEELLDANVHGLIQSCFSERRHT